MVAAEYLTEETSASQNPASGGRFLKYKNSLEVTLNKKPSAIESLDDKMKAFLSFENSHAESLLSRIHL